jgi:polyisoprenoid-binding protein YceI
MRISGWKSVVVAASGIAGIAVFLSASTTPPKLKSSRASAQEVVLDMDPAQTRVNFKVDSSLHTVHGTFNLKSGTVHFDPDTGKAGGEIDVYVASGESGNSSRDARMHKEILETAKFPEAVFRPSQVEGKVALSGASDVKLHGIILLHGKEHEIVATVHAELASGQWKGAARFDVPYIQWGIKDPSNWLLKVKPVVNVDLEMAGAANIPN